jgi:hypothetical protein
MPVPGPVVARSATGRSLAEGPPGRDGQPGPPGGPGVGVWYPGGPLLWSPVDIVQALVSSGLETLPVNHPGGTNGENYGCSFWAFRAGRSCAGVRFRVSDGCPAINVRCILWANVLSTDTTRTTFTTSIDMVVPGPGIYTAMFGAAVPLTPGLCYVVSARDIGGQYDSRVPSTGAWQNVFTQTAAGSPQFAPDVFGAYVPGPGSISLPNNLVGGGGGDPTPDYCPCQGFGEANPIEPILT